MKNSMTTMICLAAMAGVAQADVTLDGIRGLGDMYTNSETVTWFNGHRTDDSIYGDFDSQFATTTIQYGVSTLAGDTSGTEYFFLFVEAPLYAKNMIWQDLDWDDNFPVVNTDPNAGLTEDDVSPYRVHHETHHSPGDLKLNFGTATGSEKMIFLDADGDDVFKADLDGDADNDFGLFGFKDSADYLLDNGLATEELSLARNTTMSFEFAFELDGATNEELLGFIRNGIEFHLSPERGLIPAPSSVAMLGLGGLTLARRRRPNS